MKVRYVLRLIACFSIAAFNPAAALAASTINFTDQWWVASESGWGAGVLQQGNILFIDLMVYGTDSKPAWLSGAALLQANSPTGHTVFVGDLNATTGPYYGNGFNRGAVTLRKVGTWTFDASGFNNARISYTADGVPVSKDVTRQTWASDNLTGRYNAAWHYECSNNARLTADEWFIVDITHNDNSISIHLTSAPDPLLGVFLLQGTYSQIGHMGQVVAELQLTDRGTVNFTEIEKTAFGFSGRFSGSINGCQVVNGRVSAVLR